MNIIYGSENAEKLNEKYTVLELDTFKLIDNDRYITAYCVVDSIPLDELSDAAALKELHSSLVEDFKTRNWTRCLETIDKLVGRWGGDVDSYYDNIKERVEGLLENEPANDWTHVILK